MVVLVVVVEETFVATAFGAGITFGADFAIALDASVAAVLQAALVAFPGLAQS